MISYTNACVFLFYSRNAAFYKNIISLTFSRPIPAINKFYQLKLPKFIEIYRFIR